MTAVLAVGGLVAVGGGAWLVGSSQAPAAASQAIGSVPLQGSPAPSASSPAPVPSPFLRPPGLSPRPPAGGTGSTRSPGLVRTGVATPTKIAPSPPVLTAAPVTALRLPGGAAARVIPVTAPGGQLTVPDDPAVLGWWATGARPGSGVGSVVLDGHIDSARAGLGTFARLRGLSLGQQVSVTDAAGRVWAYRVTGRRSYPKATLAQADAFDQTGPERLVMITCGGVFDRATGHYADNVVVYALPVTHDAAASGPS